MTGKVLLVDTNFSSQPILNAIMKLGFEVHVVGGNPDDALAKSAEKYWCFDYSDTNKLEQLLNREKYEFIVPGCTDRSYTSCSIISQGKSVGVEAPKIDRTINKKDKFRALAERLNISIPRTYSCDTTDFLYPVIVKPVDSYSGKGISIVEGCDSIDAAIKMAKASSPTQGYVIEEYIDGQLYSHSAFLQDFKIVKDFFVREDSTANPFVVDVSTICLDLSEQQMLEIRGSIEKIAVELSLNDGLLHTQFIIKNRKNYLIEMTRRCPGDLYSQLIELQTGFSYVENYVRPFLGLGFSINPCKEKLDLVIRHTVSTDSTQIINGIRFMEPLHIEKWVPLTVTGNELEISPNGRVGVMFLKCRDRNALALNYDKFLHRALYELF